ncbi:uncharacterized protein LOC111367571 isoform X2 [Olea europaea var. sylvestris]|nr:uncharacterized protein LOC111367571 isoform X2 [Olea europaea var. sylvestris]XP_022844285.1 uncharacterized protein LOC111367571 isoform X2 [Olea europaea var. sylvestris]
MKLRDRQDKVERMLTFYKSAKGSPFQEASTHVRGEVDVLAALLMMDSVDEQKIEAIERSGIRTGIQSRFTFETTIREKDTFVAEFVASEKELGGTFGGPLSLSKILYAANISDWCSAVAIPVGARCRDVGVATSSHEDRALTDYSAFGPPLLNQHNGSAIGIMARKSNVVASLGQFLSGLGVHQNSARFTHSLSTFGQVVYQLSTSTKLSLLGLCKDSRLLNRRVNLGALAIPVSLFKQSISSETSVEEDSSTTRKGRASDGFIALMLETELDDNTRIGGWVEMKNSNPRYLQWAVTMSDTSEDELGWGLSLGGLVRGPKDWEHFQVETFLKVKLGKRFNFEPALLYVMDGASQFPALMFRSTWSL